MDEELEARINKLIDFSERFKNTNPLVPLEVGIVSSCIFLDKTIAEVNLWQNTGATVVAIRREGNMILSPGPYAVFKDGDSFLFVGEESAYERTNQYLYGK